MPDDRRSEVTHNEAKQFHEARRQSGQNELRDALGSAAIAIAGFLLLAISVA